MPAEDESTGLAGHEPGGWMTEDAFVGAVAAPAAAPPLDDRAATLVRTPTLSWNGGALGTPVLVPFSFAVRDSVFWSPFGAPTRDGFDPARSEALDAAQRASVLEALRLWEEVCGIVFVEVPDAPARWFGGVRFQLENLPPDVAGRAGWRVPLSAGAEVTLNRGLFGDDPMRPGGDGFETLLHEIGHAIGLKHPFDGSPALPTIHNNTANTVMSYTSLGNGARLGPYDVAAAQHLYGTQAAEEGLAVRWSRGPGGSLVSTGDDAANTVNGLAVRDVVRAGGGDDAVYTHAGDDDVLPGAGADTVWGGDGADTVWAEAPRRHAALVNLGGAKELTLPTGRDLLVEVETVRFVDGQVAFLADSAAGRVFRLYAAALGRGPDPLGFGQWTQEVETGRLPLESAAEAFAGSAEFAARFGALDAAGFVALLYANVLGRAPDAAGLAFWVDAMAAGMGRAGALLGFSESAELKQRTAGAYHAGLWVVDPQAVDVLRAYTAVLDRLPDAEGLANWTAAREAGLGQHELVDRFVRSPEFQARFGGLSDREFVEQLYRTALDREADPDGAAAWTRVLDAGTDTRAGVALGFSGGLEMTVKLTPMVAEGILLA